jgi:uncharacterized SAM-binding protein YcdF (DUF218 family)
MKRSLEAAGSQPPSLPVPPSSSWSFDFDVDELGTLLEALPAWTRQMGPHDSNVDIQSLRDRMEELLHSLSRKDRGRDASGPISFSEAEINLLLSSLSPVSVELGFDFVAHAIMQRLKKALTNPPLDPQRTRIVAAAQTLYEFMAERDRPEPQKADAILVLGSNDVRVAHRAAQLYTQGVAPLVIFSGKQGRATEWLGERTEAEWLAEAAAERGLPAEATLLEPRATNTGENIRLCRELLAARFGGYEVVDQMRYVVVQKPFMLQRSWATFTRQWPGPSFEVTAPQYKRLVDYCDDSIGMTLEVIIENMVGDAQRLLYYSEVLDFQAPVHVPDHVWAATGLLVGYGFTSSLCKRST